MTTDNERKAFEKDFAKYEREWADDECRLSQAEIAAYKAGHSDGWQAAKAEQDGWYNFAVKAYILLYFAERTTAFPENERMQVLIKEFEDKTCYRNGVIIPQPPKQGE